MRFPNKTAPRGTFKRIELVMQEQPDCNKNKL